jgi:hypothetical protein
VKRWIAAALVAVGLLAGWFVGRAPSHYALEQLCRQFQADRVRVGTLLRYEIGRLESALRPGQQPGPDLVELRRRRDELHGRTRTLEVRGWEVVLLPAGAPRPPPAEFLVAGEFDVSTRTDPAALRGSMEVWMRPRGRLARIVHAMGAD